MNQTPAIDDRSVGGQDGARVPAFPRSAFRDLEAALAQFAGTERRFGRTPEQVTGGEGGAC